MPPTNSSCMAIDLPSARLVTGLAAPQNGSLPGRLAAHSFFDVTPDSEPVEPSRVASPQFRPSTGLGTPNCLYLVLLSSFMPASDPTRVSILSRRGCHLCDVLFRLAQRMEGELGLAVAKVDVDNDQRLRTVYGERIPVVLVDDVEACAGKVTEPELRTAIKQKIKKARWRRLISRILSRLGVTPRRG